MNDGRLMRKEMLKTFSGMLKPARMVMNISREELAELSGLDEGLIADVEEGRQTFSKEHYLAIASVFDQAGMSEEGNLYLALVRLLAPENPTTATEDFTLVRRWFGTFSEENMPEDDDDDDDDTQDEQDEVRLTDAELEELAGSCKIFADTSAISDENFPALVSRLEPLLRDADAVIFVPEAAIEELREEIDDCGDDDMSLNLSDALKYVERRAGDGLIKIRTYDIPGDTEDVLEGVFAKYADEYKFMLLTQDGDVAEELMEGNEALRAAHIDDKGDLIEWRR